MAVQAQLFPDNFGMPIFGSQDWMVNTSPEADFCFGFQDSQLQQNLSFQQQNPQNFGVDYNRAAWLSPNSSSTSDSFLSLCQSLDANYLEIQSQELDCILQLQHERLRSALQEQSKQQYAALLRSVKSKTAFLLRQKEEELAKARIKTMELEAYLGKVQLETEAWQRLATENEAMVMNLSSTLEQIKASSNSISHHQDSESSSCYGGSCKKDEEEDKKMVCKGCNSRATCVLFLPCKHLCSCKFCEPLFSSCPVCDTVKEGSMEIFWV